MSREFDEPGPLTTASLPDGSHVIYCIGSNDEGTDQLFYKVVRSTMDLQSGEWQVMSTALKRQK